MNWSLVTPIFIIFLLNGYHASDSNFDHSTPLTLTMQDDPIKTIAKAHPELVKTSSMMFACPRLVQSFPEILEAYKQSPYVPLCLVPQMETQFQKCHLDIQPTIARLKKKCYHMAEYLHVQYNVCLTQEDGRPDIKSALLYAVCFDTYAKEVIFTVHDINSNYWIHSPTPILQLEDQIPENHGDFLIGLADAYKKLINTDNHDYLVPQMLVPLGDMRDAERRVNCHYLNVRAQWRSKHIAWEFINQEVWGEVMAKKLQKTIVTSVSKIYYKPKINGTTIQVGLLWWKYVKSYDDNKAYVIILYNVSTKYTGYFEYVCEPSVCNKLNINQALFDYVQCCEYNSTVWERLDTGIKPELMYDYNQPYW